MAGIANMSDIRLYVVDTSYLLELYRVDHCSDEQAHKRVKNKFAEAIDSGERIYVPVPVLYEVANHVADIKDSSNRKRLAKQLSQTVKSALEEFVPWTITHLTDEADISALMAALMTHAEQFAEIFSIEKLGLTDTAVVLEAERLRKRYRSDNLRKYHVHIWTRHQAIKSREPDIEANQFV
ncbi:MAG: PIN domain-containing protein [Sulfuricellaceae bacterium]